MKSSSIWVLVLAVIAGAMTAGAAQACSLSAGYVRPTNFELVQLADAIVIATPVEEIKEDEFARQIRFRPLRAMKGPLPEVVLGHGQVGPSTPSDPESISAPHPESGAGFCNRTTFQADAEYLLFTRRTPDGHYAVLTDPYGRHSEDFHGDDSLWARTVRTYLQIQADNDPMAQIVALEALHEEARDDQPALADDIEDHLASVSARKPTAYLVQLYETLDRGQNPRWGVWTPIVDQDAWSYSDVDHRNRTPAQRRNAQLGILEVLAQGDHPQAQALFERVLTRPELSPYEVGLAVRYFAEHGKHVRALELVKQQALPRLLGLNSAQTSRVTGDIVAAFFEKGDWWNDPVLREEWSRAALSLYWNSFRVLGQDRIATDRDALEALRPTDYRSAPEITLALAEMLDEDVERWAVAELSDSSNWEAWAGDEHVSVYVGDHPGRLPLQALVLGFGGERDQTLERLFCQGGDQRYLLIEALGDWGGGLEDEWLFRIGSSPHADDDDRDGVGEALVRLYGRTNARHFYPDVATFIRTGRLSTREPPLSCPVE